MKSQTWRLVITGAMVVLAFVGFWNTLRLWTLAEDDREKMEERQPGSVNELERKAMRLGLDLQGGIHVVLRVMMEKIDKVARQDAVDRAIQVIRNRVDFTGVTEPVIQRQGDDKIIVDLPGYTDAERAEDIIGQTAQLEFKLLESYDNAQIILTKIDSVVAEFREAELLAEEETEKEPEATEAEPESGEMTPLDTSADDTGEVDLLAELLGEDTGGILDEGLFEDEDKPFTQYLEVGLVNSRTNTPWPGFAVGIKDRARVEKMLERPEVQRMIPEEIQFAWSTRSEIGTTREIYYLYVLKRKVQFLGKYLEGIKVGRGQFQEKTVDFKLSGRASAAFARLTGANIDKPLAIVIDDKVESSPMINSKIRKDGQITMGSSASLEDAKNLSIVLKAGALPAPVEIIEKNVVGPTLGSDSIRKGMMSAIAGLLIVLLFIGVYYRLSGAIADIAVLFNIFFLLAIMAGLKATLTMPGIAGIILTIGISLDANILIFERIREELRTGKTVRASIDAGYSRALLTIIDSHVTTLITAGALFLFGSGPIKGFAVTLFWGVTISLYTAVVVTKTIFDIRKGYRSLSI
ncbi:MAG: protein translocase subunit SecD [Candidatus Zixiibacteriota bacterium]|nr:MAG: protein translocase subunit SecD [candidate division Zixibacteria bacterium]